MESTRKVLCLAVALIIILAAPAMAIEKELSNIRPESQLTPRPVVGGSYDELTGSDQPFFGPSGSGSSPQSRADIVGMTSYDFQHNGTMGRQVVYTPNLGGLEYVHFVWTHSPFPPAIRTIRYNAYNRTLGAWIFGNVGVGFSGANGGYCTIDVNSAGQPIAAWHEELAANYFTYVGRDPSPPPLGAFSMLQQPGPPNCQGWVSGDGFELNSEYIWPVVEYDNVEGNDIYHIISTENPGPGAPLATIQSYIYYRLTNEVLDNCPGGPPPTRSLDRRVAEYHPDSPV